MSAIARVEVVETRSTKHEEYEESRPKIRQDRKNSLSLQEGDPS